MNEAVNTFRYPSTALSVLNEKLNEHLSPTYYVTMFYGIMNRTTFHMDYASAGHDPMFLYRAETHSVDELSTSKGYPLKLVEKSEYDERSTTIEPGDCLLLFTDGLVEVRGHSRELYGSDRLKESFLRHTGKSSSDLIQGILKDVQTFAPAEAFRDDITILVVRRRDADEAPGPAMEQHGRSSDFSRCRSPNDA